MKFALPVVAVMIITASACYAEGLDSLVEVARSQGKIQEEYSKETRVFESVKKAIDKGVIKKGQPKDEIAKKYGQPVVVVPEYGIDREKWVYKPSSSTFFDGIKIYLFFDKDNKLDEISVEGQEEKK